MSDTDPVPEVTEPATPATQEPAVEQVDLMAEASQAAAPTQSTNEGKIRSLDDLDLDGGVRAQIESYVSKAVNDAIGKHDAKQKKKLDDDGYMNRAQIEQLLQQKDAEYQLREKAKETFTETMTEAGAAPGTEAFKAVQQFYAKAVEDGILTKEILMTPAGVKTLVAMSGIKQADATPSSGLSRSAPAPDGSVTWADGTVQLNAAAGRQGSVEDAMRRALEEKIRNSR
jgi:hypothetical protein